MSLIYLSSRDVHILKSVCKVKASFSFTLIAVIILHLALISVERFIAIKFSLRYHTIVTKRRALFASIMVWLWAVAVTLVFPQALRASNNDAYRNLVHAMHSCYKLKKMPFVRDDTGVNQGVSDVLGHVHVCHPSGDHSTLVWLHLSCVQKAQKTDQTPRQLPRYFHH